LFYFKNENSIIAHITDIKSSSSRQKWAIALVWLFHLSAIFGISLGFFDFFIPKTPINLGLSFLLLLWISPAYSWKKTGLIALFFLTGMLVEYLGVNYGLLFGEYAYGSNLGPKFKGVPWLIGVNWAMLVLITGTIANQLMVNRFFKVILGALLMILMDLPLEIIAPVFDFWEFSGGVAPLQNYIAWFIIAAGLHLFFQWGQLKEDTHFSFHLFTAQIVFFTYFAVYFG
jgi:putative membrane protein